MRLSRFPTGKPSCLGTNMDLRSRLQDQPYQGYAYAYPHKTAYRPFDPPIPLDQVWKDEDRDSIYLYVHIPFCEMRCGFCNLFTTSNPKGDLTAQYLDALDLQLASSADFLGGDFRLSRGAIGGGTPSFLTLTELEKLFSSIDNRLGGLTPGMPISFEVSPATVDGEKLRLLKERGVTRISIGVQSFIREEAKSLGRPQDPATLERSLQQIREAGFPIFNIDLIYGAAGQTPASFVSSIDRALEFSPQELYLYPLYVRALTGLDKLGRELSDLRVEMYRAGRDHLHSRGFRQVSMRLFRHESCQPEDADLEGPTYCCQEDGMLGVGAGARSYTEKIHYSSEYAVGRNGIGEIIQDYLHSDHNRVNYGCELTLEERCRRFIIKSLLRVGGLNFRDYEQRYPHARHDFRADLHELAELGLATIDAGGAILTEAGMERSDTIGPWLFSESMNQRMLSYQLT